MLDDARSVETSARAARVSIDGKGRLSGWYARDMRVLGLLAGVVALLCPSGVFAAKRIVDSSPVAEATRRAEQFWGGAPCAGEVGVLGGYPSEAPTAGANSGEHLSKAAMWATWSTAEGRNSFKAPPATFRTCVVHINLRVWPSWRVDDESFAAFCKEMVHEFGHFEGFPDVGAVKGTVEYEQPEYARVPTCERYRLVYGHRTFVRPFPPGRAKLSALPTNA